jgi:3,4-dihydroxy 2-butanone 4-phosphate synthase/GTP cyclohydrolase II
MTNNPDKVRQLEAYGLTVAERVPIEVPPRKSNRDYLRTKRTKFGHMLSLVAEGGSGPKDSRSGNQFSGPASRKKR